MIQASNLKKGMVIEVNKAAHIVETITCRSPSARGGSTLYKIRTSSESFTQGMNKVLRNFKFFSLYVMRIAIPLFIIAYCIQIYWFGGLLKPDLYWYENLSVILGIGTYFNPIVFALWVLGITIIASASLLTIEKDGPVPVKEVINLFLKNFFIKFISTFNIYAKGKS